MKKGWISADFIVKSDSKKNTIIAGYASVFDITDSHNDMVVKGAFKSSKSNKVKLLWQHDVTKPIGVITSFEEDEFGLKLEAEINNKTVLGAEAAALVKQGAVGGLSIGFSIKSSGFNKDGVRVINDVDLAEISIVTFPANKHAEINNVKQSVFYQKSLNELDNLIKQLENY